MSAHGTPGPWYWLGNHSLVAGHGKRPAVLTGRGLKQHDTSTGLLVDFDPQSADGRTLAAAAELRAALEHVVAAEQEGSYKCPVCGSTTIECWREQAAEALAKVRP